MGPAGPWTLCRSPIHPVVPGTPNMAKEGREEEHRPRKGEQQPQADVKPDLRPLSASAPARLASRLEPGGHKLPEEASLSAVNA